MGYHGRSPGSELVRIGVDGSLRSLWGDRANVEAERRGRCESCIVLSEQHDASRSEERIRVDYMGS